MAKRRVAAIVKIQIQAGAATPAPPVGTALGPHGINIMDFCKAYNAADGVAARHGDPGRDHDLRRSLVHVHHQDAAHAGAAAAGRRASRRARRRRAGRRSRKVTQAQVREIAEIKMPDVNAIDIEGAMAQVAGTARSMGIEVESTEPDRSGEQRSRRHAPRPANA